MGKRVLTVRCSAVEGHADGQAVVERSTVDFRDASPPSKSGPIIASEDLKIPMIFVTSVLRPVMVHVTYEPEPSGRMWNTVWLCALNGLMRRRRSDGTQFAAPRTGG
jgi:hypothetical protein